MKRKATGLAVFVLLFATACAQQNSSNSGTMDNTEQSAAKIPQSSAGQIDTITLGAGCFWCVEAVFQRLKGVQSVQSGYSGGWVKNPDYRTVCSGSTGHAEVCQIVYDKSQLNIDEILEVFWKTHDPTTLNRQGNDIGSQYRSAIFYHNLDQKERAETLKAKLNQVKAYDKPVITEITAYTGFYKAEDYHQNYFNLNGSEPYCRFVIQPKLEKFEKVFGNKLKQN
ncbi:MAG TPA: peptide-methionine (S)-S-oxide reductase MsrA [Bacteroidia bacterium]|nr:peptide-methionine (S)-S-oxide reductase MsrA [Bacteroidia bacterium]